MKIEFFAQGDPKGQPRPRPFAQGGRARVYDPGTAEGWKSQIALAARPHLPETPHTGPVNINMAFRFRRPKSHFRTGKNEGVIRGTAPYEHLIKPDVDNLVKAVLDALTEIGMWRDDSQVVSCAAYKGWSCTGSSGCVVWINLL